MNIAPKYPPFSNTILQHFVFWRTACCRHQMQHFDNNCDDDSVDTSGSPVSNFRSLFHSRYTDLCQKMIDWREQEDTYPILRKLREGMEAAGAPTRSVPRVPGQVPATHSQVHAEWLKPAGINASTRTVCTCTTKCNKTSDRKPFNSARYKSWCSVFTRERCELTRYELTDRLWYTLWVF